MSQHFLDYFFYPRSVAVIGASNNEETLNFNLFNNLVKHKFPGRIYPVNPNAEYVSGVKAYNSVVDIDDEVDLVVSSVPAHKTIPVVKECIEKRVKGIVLVSGGFSEIGDEGGKIQDTLSKLLRDSGIRTMGPNTLSPINCSNNLIISFHYIDELVPGSVSFIFQSGMYDPRINWLFSEFHLGVSKLIDLGNKMDVNEVDALKYLSADKDTRAIAMHLETIRGDSREFIKIIRETTRKKPVIVMKTGQTEAGARAAASHTGSIIKENDAVLDTALKQAGAIRVHSLEEFLDVAKAFDYLGSLSGDRCTVGSMSGGECVLATDMCLKQGLLIADLDTATREKLREIFPPWEIPTNPMDLGVCYQFYGFEKCFSVYLGSLSSDANVDCMLLQVPFHPSFYSLETVTVPFIRARETGKSVVLWAVGNSAEYASVVKHLESHNIPIYPSLERAVRALSALARYKRIQEASY